MEVIHDSPTTESYTPLSTHQSQTPDSFYSGPPILYHQSPSAKLLIHSSDLAAAPAFSGFTGRSHESGTNGSIATTNGNDNAEAEDPEVSIPDIDIWVTSERFILFSPPQRTGLSIPYPSISLHAIQHSTPTSPSSLFLQLQPSLPTYDAHDPSSTISLTLIPSTSETPPADTPAPTSSTEERAPISPVNALFTALSACANLHPDPLSGSDDEADGEDHPAIMFEGDDQAVMSGLPPAMPGSGGWITADNVGELFDEEGNWRGRGGGPGGGRQLSQSMVGDVRGREEDGEDEGTEGTEGGVGETKWRRTE